MTHYKKNGFFDRLERLSEWIDDCIDKEINRPAELKSINKKIALFLNRIFLVILHRVLIIFTLFLHHKTGNKETCKYFH